MARTALPPQLRWPPTRESEIELSRLYPHRAAQIVRQIRAQRRARRRETTYWERVRRAESRYAIQLRSVARMVSDLIKSFVEPDPEHPDEPGIIPPHRIPEVIRTTEDYSNILDNWARSAAERMLADVMRRDAHAWFRISRQIGVELRRIIEGADIGNEIRRLHFDQVELIKSIPLESGRRVQAMTHDYVAGGRRYDELAKNIADTDGVAKWRATLIARTETAKAQSAVVQARSKAIGAEGYIWRSMLDMDVRPMHRLLEGTTHSWSDPPVAEEDGTRHAPGEFPNCFLGNTIIDLRYGCQTLWRAFYEGPLIDLVIGPEVIEVTPNHPILTPDGWVAAYLLERGQDVLCVPLQRHSIGDMSEHERVTTFDQLYRTLRSHVIGTWSNPLRLDFHGDVIVNDDIDQITLDHDLSPYWDEIRFQQVGERVLDRADRGVECAVVGGSDHIAVTRGPRLPDVNDMLLAALVGGDDLVGFGAGPDLDIVPLQQIADRHLGALVLSRQAGYAHTPSVEDGDFIRRQPQRQPLTRLAFADSGIDVERPQFQAQRIGVAADGAGRFDQGRAGVYQLRRVLDNRLREFSGHVFTMQTWIGCYPVGRTKTIAKNCRCYAEPQIPGIVD